MNIFDLSTEDYDRFLLLFDPDREKAGEKYDLLRRTLTMFFRKRKCNKINELVDRVFDPIFKMILEGKEIQNINHLALYKAKNHILKEYWREINKLIKNTTGEIPDIPVEVFEIEYEDEIDRRLIHLRFCMDKLIKNDDEKRMILGYHFNENEMSYQTRKKIAEYLGITSGNLRVKVNRLENKLFDCINDCLEKEVH